MAAVGCWLDGRALATAGSAGGKGQRRWKDDVFRRSIMARTLNKRVLSLPWPLLFSLVRGFSRPFSFSFRIA
uniref:Uncharacterized protein n=1 Tax=Bursaphelenchus xylophilus TaxID=6326 RepID=A0A1I7RR09_BURXY